jgi:hypothetical protein
LIGKRIRPINSGLRTFTVLTRRRWILTQVNLSLSDIYKALCPKCQEKIVNLVKEKMTDQAIRQSLEGKKQEKVKDEP